MANINYDKIKKLLEGANFEEAYTLLLKKLPLTKTDEKNLRISYTNYISVEIKKNTGEIDPNFDKFQTLFTAYALNLVDKYEQNEQNLNKLLTIGGFLLLACFCALGWYYWTNEKRKSTLLETKAHVSLLGSGSVNNFLREKMPNLFENHDSLLVSPIEAGTDAAWDVLKSSYQKGEKTDSLASLIGMSAQKISTSDDTVNSYYSFKIGEDPLLVKIGVSVPQSPSNNNLNKKEIDSAVLNNMIANTRDFDTYVTSLNSATLKSYKNCLPILKIGLPKPEFKTSCIDDETPKNMVKNKPKSWIMLGSRYFTYSDYEYNIMGRNTFKIDSFSFSCKLGNPKPLYLYFKIKKYSTGLKTKKGEEFSGYIIDESKSRFLHELFKGTGLLEELGPLSIDKLKILEDGRFAIKSDDNHKQIIEDDFSKWLKHK